MLRLLVYMVLPLLAVGVALSLAIGRRRAVDGWRATWAVYKKEIKSYVIGPIPYLLVLLMSVVTTYFVFTQGHYFLYRQASMGSMGDVLPYVFAVFVPALAMRLWSEEIRGETVETLMTSPVPVKSLVMGKFLAGLTVIAAGLVATAGVPITAKIYGNVDPGPVEGTYAGAVLMAAAFLALGLWLSSTTRNQIVAFLVASAVCIALVMLDTTTGFLAGTDFARTLAGLSAAVRFRSIARGVVDLRDVAYFVSFIGFFLYLNVETVENRRHR